MKAAVITSFDSPPRYDDFADPIAEGPGEMLVDVLAVGLHPLTRARPVGHTTRAPSHFPRFPAPMAWDAARMVCSATSW